MRDKKLVLLHGTLKKPPFSEEAQDETGYFLRQLQQGKMLSMPHSRPMPSIGPRCHELRIRDHDINWRIVYRIDSDTILVADVFAKKTEATPENVIDSCRKRLADYDNE
ncbi:MAG: type II toxin-antitoxin system RelE/ParE family toxin [Janthinobacterium lividum]